MPAGSWRRIPGRRAGFYRCLSPALAGAGGIARSGWRCQERGAGGMPGGKGGKSFAGAQITHGDLCLCLLYTQTYLRLSKIFLGLQRAASSAHALELLPPARGGGAGGGWAAGRRVPSPHRRVSSLGRTRAGGGGGLPARTPGPCWPVCRGPRTPQPSTSPAPTRRWSRASVSALGGPRASFDAASLIEKDIYLTDN